MLCTVSRYFCNRGSGGSSAIKFLEQMHTKAVGRCQLVFSCLCGLVLQRDACATVICLVFFYIYTSAPQPTAELVKKKLQHSHNLTVQWAIKPSTSEHPSKTTQKRWSIVYWKTLPLSEYTALCQAFFFLFVPLLTSHLTTIAWNYNASYILWVSAFLTYIYTFISKCAMYKFIQEKG